MQTVSRSGGAIDNAGGNHSGASMTVASPVPWDPASRGAPCAGKVASPCRSASPSRLRERVFKREEGREGDWKRFADQKLRLKTCVSTCM